MKIVQAGCGHGERTLLLTDLGISVLVTGLSVIFGYHLASWHPEEQFAMLAI